MVKKRVTMYINIILHKFDVKEQITFFSLLKDAMALYLNTLTDGTCSNLSKFHCLISLSGAMVLWSDKVNSSVIFNLTEACHVYDKKEPGVQIMTSEKGELGECHICQPALC